jgi:hypothetical protein
MKKREIKSCIDCPFCYHDYDDFSMGDNTILICTLAEFERLNEYIIDSYDSGVFCDYCNNLEEKDVFNDDMCECRHKVTTTPEWCPIKKHGKIELVWK